VKPDDIIVRSFSFMAQFEDVGGLLEVRQPVLSSLLYKALDHFVVCNVL